MPAAHTLTIPQDEPSMIAPPQSGPVLPPLLKPLATDAVNVEKLTAELTAKATTPRELLELEELKLRIGEMRERAAVKQLATDTLRNQRLQVATQIQRKLANDQLERDVCHHLKEKGEPYTVGMRDHRGNTNVHCQKCHRDWFMGPHYTHDERYNPRNPDYASQHPKGLKYSDRVPGGLLPKGEFIGGPDLRVISQIN